MRRRCVVAVLAQFPSTSAVRRELSALRVLPESLVPLAAAWRRRLPPVTSDVTWHSLNPKTTDIQFVSCIVSTD